MPAQRDAAERVRLRLKEWADRIGHGAGKKLSDAVAGKYGEPRSPQWASGVLSGESDLRLKDLDAVAELLGVPPGDLVRRDGDFYLEVIPSEMKFLTHLRSLPDTIRQHMLRVWDYLFEFQDIILKDQKAQVDKRTAAARTQRERMEALRKKRAAHRGA